MAQVTPELSEIESRIRTNEAQVIFNMHKTLNLLQSKDGTVVTDFPSYFKGKAKLTMTLKSAKLEYSDATQSFYQEV